MNTLEIEWKHLDVAGNTCIRCADTGEDLLDVVEKLSEECEPCGWRISFKDTRLSVDEIPESNTILFNGKPIEKLLPTAKASESHCQSCCEFTGNDSTHCRTVELGGETYEAIPGELIRQAVCAIAGCCQM